MHIYFATKGKNRCTIDPQSGLVGLRSGKVAVSKRVTSQSWCDRLCPDVFLSEKTGCGVQLSSSGQK